MKIYSWNVNGIRAVLKKGTFQKFVSDHQPDILCLQETKAKPEQVILELPGYNQFWYSAQIVLSVGRVNCNDPKFFEFSRYHPSLQVWVTIYVAG